MNKICINYFKSSVGELILGDYNNQLCICDWRYRKKREAIDTRIRKGLDAEYVESETELLKEVKNQISEYLQKERTVFDLPLLFVGTNFQRRVWGELQNIPFGKTITYSKLSINLGDDKAIRAVSSANGANAISIIVPCHRVIGSNGKLVGYAGGLKVKQQLLSLEGYEGQKAQLSLWES